MPYFDWKEDMLKIIYSHPYFLCREVSDLLTCVEELYFNKQKLEEENNQLKLTLEMLEEANSRLSEDCTELCLQIKR